VEIMPTIALVDLKQAGGALLISGSADNLYGLGSRIQFLADKDKALDQVGRHMHVEHYPEHLWLTPSSCPLVVTVDSTADDE
jgi:hypothetical protein